MRKHIFNSIMVTLFASAGVLAQEKEKDSVLGTQTVNVVKAYTPSVSDAFKIKGTPSLDDSVTTSKKKIDYKIFSVPVASTFTPAKGKASAVEKAPKEKLYNTYASLGLGNYTSVLADFFTSRALSRTETVDVGLRHHSSQGGIDGVDLDNAFFNTKLDASYFKRDRDYTWGADLGFQHQIYNWYGVEEGLFEDAVLANIDEKQTYYNGELGAHINFNEGYFRGGNVLFRRFWDGMSSGENRLVAKPSFKFPVQDQLVTTHIFVDYLSGKFDRSYYSEEELKYSNVQLGINPNIVFIKDDVTFNLGATVAYMMDIENSESKFYVFPNISASYTLLEGFVTAYAGAKGDLQQNSYYGFANDNQFVSPTLTIAPSFQQYDIYGGIKGKFLPNLSYDLKAGYSSTDDYAFFVHNPNSSNFGLDDGYVYGNSFNVVYDKLNTLKVDGEVNLTISDKFSLGANGMFASYSTDELSEAYNLPSVRASIFSDFKIGEKWFGGASVFFMGERKDVLSADFITIDPADTAQEVTLDGYFDVNFNLGYNFTDRLSGFARLNNIANNDYQRWANYKVQGFQAVLGATYKFDF
ncbi:hypothetical protein SAMN05216480_102293 [Pustulibacterium marinum]|uniref:Uncharacterized protein n=1 Tax=Pustulibacterium marinum TaxID=1224947 RepID=A0A1I7FWQ9_9FLAO|nr:TonB-dependent receptor [Pustulibacterium marinum]SFU40466.1 hypothetical protein SAMN05216480_102293 [Pustulibacterium marinum]